jgi:hypothetical protein
MMTCKEAARLASESLDHPLSGRRRWSLWFHLAVCGMCRRFARSLAALQELFRLRRDREPSGQATMPPEVRDRMARNLRER